MARRGKKKKSKNKRRRSKVTTRRKKTKIRSVKPSKNIQRSDIESEYNLRDDDLINSSYKNYFTFSRTKISEYLKANYGPDISFTTAAADTLNHFLRLFIQRILFEGRKSIVNSSRVQISENHLLLAFKVVIHQLSKEYPLIPTTENLPHNDLESVKVNMDPDLSYEGQTELDRLIASLISENIQLIT